MLGKLIKHDMRVLSRVLLPMFLGIAAISLLSSLALAFNVKNLGENVHGVLQTVLSISTGIFTFFGIIALCAGTLVTLFLVVRHFYNSVMSSEGYLTFTLPVTTGKILFSKMLTGYIWMILCAVLSLLCVFLLILVGSAPAGSFINTDIFRFIGEGFSELSKYWESSYTVFLVEVLLSCIIAPLELLLQIYVSIVIGSMISRKYKILTSIGIYLAISIVTGILSSIITAFGSFSGYYDNVEVFASAIMRLFSPMMLASMVFTLVCSAAYYFVTRYLLTNKLNLE